MSFFPLDPPDFTSTAEGQPSSPLMPTAKPALRRRFTMSILVLALILSFAPHASALTGDHGPWDLESLRQVPNAEWTTDDGPVRGVFFKSEPHEGKPTRVFAYYSRPKDEGRFPGLVLLHGGGGRAFAEWTQHWSARGYAAIAVDLTGSGPQERLPDGGPAMNDDEIFRNFETGEESTMWTYHAVAAAIRAHSLLRSLPEVDASRTAVTGISWGGYLTCIVASLDNRFQAAVPVYGCGFIHENSAWVEPRFVKMDPDHRQRWVRAFDPSSYLTRARCSMFFVNGTNDFAYPLDSHRKSCLLPAGEVAVSLTINRPHSHIWTFGEVDAFIDSHLAGGKPLPKLGPIMTENGMVNATWKSDLPVKGAWLDFTTDAGPWIGRKWQSIEATIANGKISAELPAKRPLACYLRVTDERGLPVSTLHLEFP